MKRSEKLLYFYELWFPRETQNSLSSTFFSDWKFSGRKLHHYSFCRSFSSFSHCHAPGPVDFPFLVVFLFLEEGRKQASIYGLFSAALWAKEVISLCPQVF